MKASLLFLSRIALLVFLVPLSGCGGGSSSSSPTPKPKPSIVSFTATPASITAGDSCTLTWSVNGAVSLAIDHGVGAVTGTSHSVNPSTTTTYTLTATNSSGSTTATTTVSVSPIPKPIISSFTATPSSITVGESSTLTWSVTGAASISIDQGVGSVTGTSHSVNPSATTTYTLTAGNTSGQVSATATVTVTSLPIIQSFVAKPSFVTTGQSSTLSWSVTGATALSISDIGPVTGNNMAVTPAADTDYVLTASNEFGSVEAHATVTVFASAHTWFAPLGTAAASADYGSVDYMELFTPDAPWSTAASDVQVFKLYAGMLTLPDDDLRRLFSDVQRRHMALGLEFGPLVPEECGAGVEGFDGSHAHYYAQRIHDLGGILNYVAFDEPFFYASMYRCGWTPDHVAQNAANSVNDIKSIFPDVLFGDIEVVPAAFVTSDWLNSYQAWMDAWEKAYGAPLAFFHCDTNMETYDWRVGLAALYKVLQQRKIPLGMIYTGNGSENSDQEWVDEVEGRFTDYELRGSPGPDQVIFQSWQPYPRHLLPETDSSTFTHLIDRYFRTRTIMTSTVTSSMIQGRLTTADNAPLGITAVQVSSASETGSGQPATYTITGTLPTGAFNIIFGVRVNTECNHSGAVDFYLNSIKLDAGTAGTLSVDFSNQLTGWNWWGYVNTLEVVNSSLHIVADTTQYIGMNYTPLVMTGAGQPYTFTVNATIPTTSAGNACVAMIFNSAGRKTIAVLPQPILLGNARTAADGTFSLDLGSSLPSQFTLWADYLGSNALWPSSSNHRMGIPTLSLVTTSLPSGNVGVFYMQSLAATGGRAPYLWGATGLPPGFTLRYDGTLSGTPTAIGDYTTTIFVADDATPTQVATGALNVQIQ